MPLLCLPPSACSLFITIPETGANHSYCWIGREGQKMRGSVTQATIGIWWGRSQQVNNGSFARLQLGVCYLQTRDSVWYLCGQLCGHSGWGADLKWEVNSLRWEVNSQHYFLSNLSTSWGFVVLNLVFAKYIISKLALSKSYKSLKRLFNNLAKTAAKSEPGGRGTDLRLRLKWVTNLIMRFASSDIKRFLCGTFPDVMEYIYFCAHLNWNNTNEILKRYHYVQK